MYNKLGMQTVTNKRFNVVCTSAWCSTAPSLLWTEPTYPYSLILLTCLTMLSIILPY